MEYQQQEIVIVVSFLNEIILNHTRHPWLQFKTGSTFPLIFSKILSEYNIRVYIVW